MEVFYRLCEKFFERILEKQIAVFLFMWVHKSTQHALISLIEKWNSSLGQKGYTGSILMNLSKAFDTLYHNLLLANLLLMVLMNHH